MHELDADMPAVGTAQDFHDLAHGRDLEAEHLVDEDRPVEIRVRESVSLGLQLLVDLALGQAQRIEIGCQMPHRAIGADQHQRPDAVLGGAHGRHRAHVDAGRACAGLQPAANMLLGLAVVARQRAQQLTIAFLLELLERLGPRRPAISVAAAEGRLVLLQAGEEMAPLVAHRAGVALVLRLHLLDVGGVGALQG